MIYTVVWTDAHWVVKWKLGSLGIAIILNLGCFLITKDTTKQQLKTQASSSKWWKRVEELQAVCQGVVGWNATCAGWIKIRVCQKLAFEICLFLPHNLHKALKMRHLTPFQAFISLRHAREDTHRLHLNEAMSPSFLVKILGENDVFFSLVTDQGLLNQVNESGKAVSHPE